MSRFLQFISSNKYQLLLIFVVLIVLYPLSLFIHLPKWDNVNAYLPYRFFISDALWNGHLPLWNSYIYLGYPGYSDMQGGCWNPIFWMLLFFGKYTVTSLIIELLIYYVIAGLGFFKLSMHFFKKEAIAFFLGVSYALSGFMVGTSQIMVFIIAAALFPWIIYFTVNYLKSYEWKYLLGLALFVAIHITSAYPAFTIILIYILAVIFAIHFFQIIRSERVKYLLRSLYMLILIGVMVLPYIISFLDFAPYFSRGQKLVYGAFLLSNPFTLKSYLSFILPYSVIAKTTWLDITDLSLRNAYVGILPIIIFVAGFFTPFNRFKWGLLGGIFFSLLLAAGSETFIYQYAYKLPGFGLFRHSSMFRLYTIVCLFLWVGNELYRGERITIVHKRVFGLLVIGLIFLLVYTLIKGGAHHFVDHVKGIWDFKEFSDQTIYSHVFLNTFIVLFILGLFGYLLYLRVHLWKILLIVLIIDLGVQTRLTMPTTVCYPFSFEEHETYFDNLSNSIDQTVVDVPFKKVEEMGFENKASGIYINEAIFNKQISRHGYNPTRFTSFNNLRDTPLMDTLMSYPIIAAIDSSFLELSNKHIGYNSFTVTVKNKSSYEKQLLLNQNYHHLWNAELDNGHRVEIKKYKGLIMQITLPANYSGNVSFEYRSPYLLLAIIVMMLGYIFIMLQLLRFKMRSQM